MRDGLAFVFAWDAGVILYDVGNGIRGGSPEAPVEVSRLVTQSGEAGSPSVHNGWWFHNPVTMERRYLFVGQEGAATTGSEKASGDIHVVDASNLAQPREVAFFHMEGAGTHNFWMDEARQILYAAYYNGGVVALDVSGTLAGDLSGRLLGQVVPRVGRETPTSGACRLANGYLYAIDMLSGLWQVVDRVLDPLLPLSSFPVPPTPPSLPAAHPGKAFFGFNRHPDLTFLRFRSGSAGCSGPPIIPYLHRQTQLASWCHPP